MGNQFEAACGKVYTLDGKGIINQESRNDKIAIIPHEKHTEWLYKEIWDIGYQLNQQNWNFSIEALEERLRSRGTEDEEKIQKRLDKAEKELGYAKWFDTIVINENLEQAQQEVLARVSSFLRK